MKKTLVILVAATFMSCGVKETQSIENEKVIGTWEYVDSTGWAIVHNQYMDVDVPAKTVEPYKYQNKGENPNLYHSLGCDEICTKLDKMMSKIILHSEIVDAIQNSYRIVYLCYGSDILTICRENDGDTIIINICGYNEGEYKGEYLVGTSILGEMPSDIYQL